MIGLATFAIAKWDRSPQHGNAIAGVIDGTGQEVAEACGEATSQGPVDPTVNFECQMVWAISCGAPGRLRPY